MSLENNLAEIITRFEDLAGKADAAEARMDGFIANARSDFAGLNLLKNARAYESDGEGGFVSPLGIHTSGQPTLITQRVLRWDDPDVPAGIYIKAARGFGQVHFNVIELTLSQNGGTGAFNLLPQRPIRGRLTAGCLGAYANADGITLLGRQLPSGELVENIQISRDRWFNNDTLEGSVLGENIKLWIVAPFVSPGHVEASSVLFTLSEDYYFHDS